MKKTILKAAFLSSAIAIAPLTMAAGTPRSGPNPFSDCGIGASLFDNKVAATISNVIWDIGTTAVISATASPETCSGKQVEAAVFIHNSYDSIVEETAKGSGEHVTAVLNFFECNQSAHAAVTSNVRTVMGDIVSASDYDSLSAVAKSSAYYDAVSFASKGCSS